MRKTTIGIATAALLFALAGRASAQQTSAQQTSSQTSATQQAQTAQTQTKTPAKGDALAEASRKALEAQKNAAQKPKVFTNDNISTVAAGNVAVIGNASAATAEAQPASTSATSEGNDEAAWREKFAKARDKLKMDQQELSVLQREGSQLQVQYYPDPTKALMQSVTRSDITKNQQAIDAKQKEVQADQQAISDLEDALRKAGGDPGWARE